ncbi:hypothetical protein HGB24_01175, partial [Candidatus Saccharibacteria bacterium]|nr:hypothetical protein [Candidatus Saccharibacteria bacterium]
MTNHKKFLLIFGLVAFTSSIIGWINYFSGTAVFSVITWPIIWTGLFVWGDAMILGAFLAGACYFLWRKNDPVLTGLFFSVYYVIRSFIEALYNLNAQFSSVSRPWEAYTVELAPKLHFQPQELFVVPQITYTAICITALMFFIYYLKLYFMAPISKKSKK